MLRLASEEDFDRIVEMARRFHQESPYLDLPFSVDQCRILFDTYLKDPTTVIIIVGDHGMIIGAKHKPPFSTEIVTSEIAWWVDHEARGSRESIELMKAYTDWSIRIGATITQMAMLDDVTDLDKFYRRSGFTPAERSYIRVNKGS